MAGYTAEHWVRPAQIEDVASRIKRIKYLVDLDKPYFEAWCQLDDVDTPPLGLFFSDFLEIWPKTHLPYYAAPRGFQNLVEELIIEHPWHVNARKTLPSSPGTLSQRFIRSVDPRGRVDGLGFIGRGFISIFNELRMFQDRGTDPNLRLPRKGIEHHNLVGLR